MTEVPDRPEPRDPAGRTLVTSRLLIRLFAASDAPAVAGYRSAADVARYQSWTLPYTVQDAQSLVGADPREPGWCQYVAELRTDHSVIGDLGVNLSPNLMQAEIGFTLAPAFQRVGYGSEAVRRILDHLFIDRGLHKVSAECDARNVASARLLKRVGFRGEGLRRSHTWIKGEWTDDLLFGLLAADRTTDGTSA